MPAPATTEEFLDLVRKSGVLDDKKLSTYLDKLRTTDGLPEGSAALSDRMVGDGVLTQFQAEQFMLGKWRRFSIGKYKVLERLGSGGMGSVYLCEHKLMRRRVAVKVLPTAKAEDPSSLERFYREARAVAALDHPNIVRAYDIDQDEKLHFIVMEYVDGASLQEIIKKTGPMDVLRAAHYVRQSALGLQHAHEAAGLVHRDIKPGNILIDRSGLVKILDMGLARFFHDEEDILTKKYDENVLGTADYLAPEQALDSHAVDIRADIYSLGATFYFCLTGRTPFTEGSVAQKLIWHQTRAPKPIRSLRPEVTEQLVAIIDKMMAKDPTQRYQTPIEVAQALEPFTRTEIGPPPADEMPQLSPALMGGTVPTPDAQGGQPGPGSSVTGRKNWQVPASPSPRPAAAPAPRATSTQTAVPTQTATRSTAGATVRPATNGPLATSPSKNTPPATPKTSPITRPTPLPKQAPASSSGMRGALQNRPWLWWVLIGVAVVVVVGLVLGIALFVFGNHSGNRKVNSPASSQHTLIVSRRQPDAIKTVREALDKAGPGDRIKVMDEQLQEQLYFERKTWDTEVVLESGLDKPVVWSAPIRFDADRPLVSFVNVSGLRIKGFTFDGEDRVHEGLRFVGHCPGLVLEAVQVQYFKSHEVRLLNCEGEKDRKVALLGVRTLTKLSKKSPAFAFTIVKDIPSVQQTQELIVRDCRFEGPYDKPVQAIGVMDRVEWVNNVRVAADGAQAAVPQP
jgi:serine/threonine protein kinase